MSLNLLEMDIENPRASGAAHTERRRANLSQATPSLIFHRKANIQYANMLWHVHPAEVRPHVQCLNLRAVTDFGSDMVTRRLQGAGTFVVLSNSGTQSVARSIL
jgi:curli biogenesis system outer membrane secretion channel CsgG